jgi:hypothetical protein
MEEKLSEFAAREPSLGYFYQIRYGLYLLLSNRDIHNAVLKIENLDDIEIHTSEKSEIFQTKLKMKSKANLTNASVDFWKTVRIWADNIRKKRVRPETTIFSLISTEKVSDDSFLNSFKKGLKTDEEITKLISKMDKVATDSTNAINKNAYEEYLKLTISEKTSLLRNIHLIDSASDIDQISNGLKAQLAFSAPPNQIENFLEILEGWWFQTAVNHLLNKKEQIESKELQAKVSSIRDSFSQDNLPNHFGKPLEISDQEAKDMKDKTYIKQLEIVSISLSSNTAKRAISDFRRAFEQRSKWLRLELLSPDEQNDYDDKLYDHWKNLFDIVQDHCDGKEIEQIREIGNKFYLNRFALSCPTIKIREKFNEDYLTRGSFQILSDSKRIGWHPKYKDLIK